MSLILKIMSGENTFDADPSKTYCLYADVVSVHFVRQPDGSAMAHCWLREPVKTAEVAGFCEVEKWIDLTGGNVYVMNEAGKTVASFSPTAVPGGGQVGPA